MAFKSPVKIKDEARQAMAADLQPKVADALDLYSQVKMAHWNLKGEDFVFLHKFLDEIGDDLVDITDLLAERVVTLVGRVEVGDVRSAAKVSKVLPLSATQSEYCYAEYEAIAVRLEQFIEDLRTLIDKGQKARDYATVNMLSTQIEKFEKHAWFVRSTLDVDETEGEQNDQIE